MIQEELKYTKDHEWLRQEGELVTVGITHHAQEQLGDVVFVELPEVGSAFQVGDTFGTVESVKAVSDLYSPISGEVVEVNAQLEDTPELINSEPYVGGWMLKLKIGNVDEMTTLMDANAYGSLLG
ncbi:MAG: glycine cleavage system protein GcvH [Myxococcota bacterium]|nr:glycine cleavage system protein GcvH [Myxococcota bacterium]